MGKKRQPGAAATPAAAIAALEAASAKLDDIAADARMRARALERQEARLAAEAAAVSSKPGASVEEVEVALAALALHRARRLETARHGLVFGSKAGIIADAAFAAKAEMAARAADAALGESMDAFAAAGHSTSHLAWARSTLGAETAPGALVSPDAMRGAAAAIVSDVFADPAAVCRRLEALLAESSAPAASAAPAPAPPETA